jgi:2-polyprenyl-3-methyl-5-hydroxy-6-metoxy-1,4-benzoquinol methylase
MENLVSCPVCGDGGSVNLFQCKDFVATGEMFQLVRCRGCSFVYTNPRPSLAEIGKYYQTPNYVSHAGSKQQMGLVYRLYDIVRNISNGQKLRVIRTYNDGGKLLDLGCGLGYFLKAATETGVFDATGVDVSEDAVRFAKEELKLSVYDESHLRLFPPGAFNVITQWHVLEHVHQLNDRVRDLKRLLQAEGTMFIAVPNCDSWDAKKYGAYWDGYDVPRHLYHFTPETFNKLMANHGFRTIAIKPMLFDAPYISMRSEAHQNHSASFLRGLINGTISTFKALNTGNYSSLLFVVKHAD